MQEVSNQILVVDGDAKVTASFQQLLGQKYRVATAASALEASIFLDSNPHVAVVIAALNLPGVDGIEFLKGLIESHPAASRILLTNDRTVDVAKRAVNDANVLMYLNKPCAIDEMEGAIRNGLTHHARVIRERALLEKTLAGSVKILIEMLSLFHADAFRKTGVMRQWAMKVAKALGIKKTWDLEMAVMFSPLGEALLPKDILSRYRSAKSLTDPQREMLSRAPEQTRDLLRNIPQFERIAEVLYFSNRGYDGSGFPSDGPVGKDIPLNSRILKILTDLWYASPDSGLDMAAFEALGINRKQYDPKLLQIVRETLLADEIDKSQSVQIVSCHIRALHPGDVLVDDILTDGSHELVLSRGHQLTETTIKRLWQFDRLSGLRQPIRVRRIEQKAEAVPA